MYFGGWGEKVCWACDTLWGTLRRASVPSVGSVVIKMSDFSRAQSSSVCVCASVRSYVVIKCFLTDWVCMSDNLDVMCGIHKQQSFMLWCEFVFYYLSITELWVLLKKSSPNVLLLWSVNFWSLTVRSLLLSLYCNHWNVKCLHLGFIFALHSFHESKYRLQ